MPGVIFRNTVLVDTTAAEAREGFDVVVEGDRIREISETPVKLQLPNAIKLKSALNLLLNELELTHVIEDDVLKVTSMEAKRTKVYPKTYRVTDLVTPIPNFTSGYEDGLAGALRAAYQMSNPQADVQVMPVSMTDLGMVKNTGGMGTDPAVLGQYHSMGAQGGFGMGSPAGSRGVAVEFRGTTRPRDHGDSRSGPGPHGIRHLARQGSVRHSQVDPGRRIDRIHRDDGKGPGSSYRQDDRAGCGDGRRCDHQCALYDYERGRECG